MNKAKRLRLIRSMDFIMSCFESEMRQADWHTNGIPNDIPRTNKELDFYTNDEELADLMNAFMSIIEDSFHDEFQCDGVTSN